MTLSKYWCRQKTLEFGLVKSDDEGLIKKYKIKSFPAFLILKNGEKGPIVYNGEDFSYAALFEFINTYSETFVFSQTEEPVESRASRPWLSEPVPFLSKQSANDICLKKDGVLCVIYVLPTAAQSDASTIEALQNVQEAFTSKIERGITFSFMRLDISQEPDFAAVFNLEEGEVPGLVIMNPGKKKRFLKGEYGLTQDGVTQTLDKILGGDARFKIIKGNKLPELTQEHPQVAQ
jgi:hypothetical protein